MLVIQNLVNFSVAGNKQNPFSITLYFASGSVPDDLDADVYYDEERTAIASLKPVFETITTRTDAVRMTISGEQMLATSEYSLLFLEITYGGMVQTRGTLKADSRTETTPRQDYFKLHTFGGDEIGVAISESLTQALNIQADVTAKRNEAVTARNEAVVARNGIEAVAETITEVAARAEAAATLLGNRHQEFSLTAVTDQTYTHNFGTIATASLINASGQVMQAQVTHTVNTTRIQSNNPITGKLILTY